MASEAKRAANARYRQEKRDQLAVDIPKGKRDAYKRIAAELNLSLSQLIQNGVEGYALVHAGEGVIPAVPTVEPTEKLTADERRLVQAASKVPDDTRKLFLKLVEDLASKLETKGGDSNGKVERAG